MVVSRRDRRRTAARTRKFRVASKDMAFKDIDSQCDIQVEGKPGGIVMVFAKAKGRPVVEDQFPDIEWSTEAKFRAAGHSDDWLFTHVRITRCRLVWSPGFRWRFVSNPDPLGFAVA